MKFLVCSFILLASVKSFATNVRCEKLDNPKHFVILALDKNNDITQMNERKYVLSDSRKDSEFSYLSQDLEESGFEGISAGTAKNKYKVVTFTTTADSMTLGISPDLTTGFYRYRDLGSGNGNSEIPLKCAVVTKKQK